MSTTPAQIERLIRYRELESIIGLKKSAIYDMMKAGTFPEPVQLSARAVAWKESDVVAWQSKLASGVRDTPTRKEPPKRMTFPTATVTFRVYEGTQEAIFENGSDEPVFIRGTNAIKALGRSLMRFAAHSN